MPASKVYAQTVMIVYMDRVWVDQPSTDLGVEEDLANRIVGALAQMGIERDR